MDTQLSRRVQLLNRWMAKRSPAASSARLGLKTIYILPTRQGLLFMTVALVVFVAAANYELSLAFAMSFLMVSVFLLTVVHTYLNLHNLTLAASRSAPCFCGEKAIFSVELGCEDNREHESVVIHADAEYTKAARVTADRPAELFLALTTRRRGHFRLPRLKVETSYPLGLWRAWSQPDLDMTCLVYPAPLACEMPLLTGQGDQQGEHAVAGGSEDYYGLRAFQPGDTPSQVDWKSLAKSRGLNTKQFTDPVGSEVMLDWHRFSGMDTEQRLSCLCYQVLRLSALDVEFGLRLPGMTITPAQGSLHRAQLLEVLATWQ